MNWSESIAAYKYALIIADANDFNQLDIANRIYESFLEVGRSVYMDDRDIRIGEKLNEVDLIGTPIKILIGKNIKNNQCEVKRRSNDVWKKVDLHDIIEI